ncbi:MAG: sodium:proton antiporter [Deltaproteobacteria bacterium]|nr:sodium:proton antiporter [Deltaproteobacteria bacterium]MBW2200124.1 sodium:proton antiporter [Deltaproteobacteria bacterium]
MTLFNIIAVLVTLSAIFSYINYRYIRLPGTIGLMLIALLVSLGLIAMGPLGFGFEEKARLLLRSIDFDETLLHGMLSFLLFAGALHINLEDLSQQKWIITSLATLSVIGSTFLVGILSWWVFIMLGLGLPMMYCFLFGALISPTDPIAVLSILKGMRVPKSLETKISGESLFNDGVAVVIFLILLDIVTKGHAITPEAIVFLFAREALGGIVFGLAIGLLAYWMLKRVDNYQVEVLITLGLVTGGYALADTLHISGPISIVVAGLLIGNHGRLFAMSEKTRTNLDMFWELVDVILNAVLFVLIGLEVLVLTFTREYLTAAILVIPIVMLVRFISVGIPVTLLRFFRSFSPHVVKILTWSGLRGGISIALALSLPASPHRDVILVVTYGVVVFSILVQGLTIRKVVRALHSLSNSSTRV